jgi:hypothetical protein
MTGDHDDRVVPAHSFKFAARLQEYNDGTNPTVIRIETRAGHGAGKSTEQIIDEQTDKWAFMFYNMQFNPYSDYVKPTPKPDPAASEEAKKKAEENYKKYEEDRNNRSKHLEDGKKNSEGSGTIEKK